MPEQTTVYHVAFDTEFIYISVEYDLLLFIADNTIEGVRNPVKRTLMSFGHALKKFREARDLSLRELGKLCEIDHAYIHRLEKDEKTAPSEQIIDSFVRYLKLTPRRARLLRLLVGKSMNEELVDVFIEDEDRPLDLLEPSYQMSFRGKRPETKDEWRRHIDRLDALFDDEEV